MALTQQERRFLNINSAYLYLPANLEAYREYYTKLILSEQVEINSVIKILRLVYKEHTEIEINFSRELEKNLKTKEKEEKRQEIKKRLRDENKWLLDLATEIHQKYTRVTDINVGHS